MPRSRRKKLVENDEKDVRNSELEKRRHPESGDSEISGLRNGSTGTTKSKSNVMASGLSPAKKLRQKLTEKKETTSTHHKELEKQQKEVISSKYFLGGGVGADSSRTRSQRARSSRKQSDVAEQEKPDAASGSEVSHQKRTGSRSRKRKQPKSNSLTGVVKPLVKNVEKSDDEFLSEPEKPPKRTLKSPQKRTQEPAKRPSIADDENKKKRPKKSSDGRSKTRTATPKRGRGKKTEDEKHLAENNDPDELVSDSESEWEEVEELPEVETEDSWQAQIPDRPVQIMLKASDLITKRKKGKVDIKDIFRRQLNRFRTESQENAHKVHLLCLLSHGQHVNAICCGSLLKSVALSLVPPQFCDRQIENWTLSTMSQFTKWFRKTVPIETSENQESQAAELLSSRLLCRFSQQSAKTEHEFILMFVISCRAIGLPTRLIYALQPLTFKPSDLRKTQPTKNVSASAVKTNKTKNNPKKTQNKESKDVRCPSISSESGSNMERSASLTNDSDQLTSDERFRDDRLQPVPEDRRSSLSHPAGNIGKTKNQRLRRRASKVNYNEEEAESTEESKDDEWKREDDPRSEDELESNDSESDSESRRKSKKKKTNSSEEDFEDSDVSFRKKKVQQRNVSSKSVRRKSSVIQISDEERFSIVSKTSGSDWWMEVYLDEEKKWICVNGPELDVNCPSLPERRATLPFSYILAFDNDGNVKDVTAKFAADWMSLKNKVRVDEVWWKKVLQPFQNDLSERSAREDKDIHEHLMKKPLPTSISDFKNHPLYALRRHLLKYEAIYPQEAPVLGHIRGEPVYPRESVHCLHAKEKWMLEGRLVRIEEEPYKIVRARPKWNKPKEFNDRLKLPLYGLWQTEQYIPLPAVEGKVPKNDYGNVEVFKPWMIPGGTVYLPETMSGFGRVAKKLNIDVAPAMVGWDFHSGFNVPILQGWIVCEEHKDVLVAAWEEDQAIQRQKEADKRQQKVLDNWKLLTRGLLIRERLKRRFHLQEPTEAVVEQNENKSCADDGSDDAKESTAGISSAWPENRKIGFEIDRNSDPKNMFPFEKEYL